MSNASFSWSIAIRLARPESYAALIKGAAIAALLAGTAEANPNGPSVVHGAATFSSKGGSLSVTNTPGAIINWQDFSVGSNQITRFNQQNSLSSVLNRVISANPSKILGELSSNGRIFLINPNGILFGRNARINTASLVASTLNMSDANFIAGNYQFEGNGGTIDNQGYIKTGKDGDVVFIAPDIKNSGIIETDGGHLLLAAGKSVNLTSLNDDHITFEVRAPEGEVLNLGSLLANGGSVSIYAGTLRQRGVIQANRVWSGSNDGMIYLFAEKEADIGGNISASGGTSTSGGRVTVLGDQVNLRGARIDATGTSGGEVLVGGDYQGRGFGPKATNTLVDSASRIDASATTSGDGGRVIVWSENHTQAHGELLARGGPFGGDGGLIETSGRKSLEFTRAADVSASRGNPGTWLLDPEDIDIDEARAGTIVDALNNGSNVAIKTSDSGEGEGNITVNAPITKSEGDDASLTMTAHNQIDVNQPITSTSGKLDVSLNAGRKVNIDAEVRTNGGNLSSVITGSAVAPVETDDTVAADDPVENTPTDIEVADTHIDTPTSEPAQQPELFEGDTTSDVTPIEVVTETQPEPALELETELDDESLDSFSFGASVTAMVDTGGGDIAIDAGDNGTALVSASLDASNDENGAIGGNIKILGANVLLDEGASVDASGHSGGGEILIGGDYRGGNPDVRNASQTYVADDVNINADATSTGNGGRVIVWADDSTHMNGNVSARGGAISGDGGFVEISGKGLLSFSGSVDLSATNGSAGTVLFDPEYIEVITGGADGASGGDIFSGDPPAVGVWSVDPTDLDLVDANIILEATQNITFTNDLDISDVAVSLTATAGNDIILDANITVDGFAKLEAQAGSISGTGLVTATSAELIAATGIGTQATPLELDVDTLAATTGTGDIAINNAGAIAIGDVGGTSGVSITGGAGKIEINAASPVSITSDIVNVGTGGITVIAGDSVSAGDNLTIAANIIDTGGGGVALIAGDDVLHNTGTISTTGSAGVTVAADNEGAGIADGDRGSIAMSDSAVINGGSGLVTLTAYEDIALGGVSTTGNVIATSTAGAIIDGGDTNTDISASTATLSAATGIGSANPLDVLLSFLGVTVTGAGNAAIDEGDGIVLNDTNVSNGNFALNAGGAITDGAGASITVSGNADFDSTTDAAITLNDTLAFGSLTFDGGAVTIVENDATVLSGTSNATSLDLDSGGSITDDGTANVTVTGNASFDSTTDAAITLDDTYSLGNLTFDGGAVTIVESDATVLSGTSNAASLDLDSGGSITDDGTANVTVTGNASFDSTTDAAITLDDTYSLGSLTFDGGAVTIVENDATVLSGTSNAASLDLDSAGSITDDGTANVTITGNASFDSTTDAAITLNDTLAFGSLTFDGGAVTIVENDATVLSGTSNATSLDLDSGGSITDDGTANVTVTGNASFDSTTDAAITLNDTLAFGSLTFDGGAVTIVESDATVLSGTSNASSLDLDSVGSITDDGTANVTVTGNASFDSTTDAAITLNDTLAFGSLTFDGGAVTIVENDATVLSGTSNASSLDLDSGGSITDDGTANVTVTGNASFDSTTDAAITLNDTLAFGSLTFDGGAVTIVENDATVLSGTSNATSLDLDSGGSITDDGTANVTVTGNASFDSTTDAAITLNDTLAFGSLTFDGGAVTIVENDATVLSGTSNAASLDLDSGGSITDDGTANVTVTGNASFDSTTDAAITLNDTLAFGSLTFDGGAVTIVENDATVLSGTSNAASLDLDSAGSITDDGTANVTVTGNASFDSTTDAAITLNDTLAFGSLTFDGGAVTIVESDATILSGTSNASSLDLDSAGSITDDGTADVTVTGNASFDSTTDAAITLNDTLAFGSLTFDGGAVTIVESNATILSGTSNASSLDLNSGGSITDDGTANVTVTGNASFDSTTDAAITLDDTYSLGSLTFDGGAVTIVESNATILSGTSNASSLDLDSAGSITDDGTANVTITGNASFDSTTDAAITLNDTLAFGSLTFDGGAVTIVENDATVLSGTSNASSLDLDSGGSITDDGTANVTITGNASFDSTTDAAITLNDTLAFGSLTFDGGVVTIVENDATVLSGTSNASSLDLDSGGSITDDSTANVAITGNADLSGSSITLGDTVTDSINFGSLTFNSSGAVNITENSAMSVVGINTAGGGTLTASSPLTISGNVTTTDSMTFTAAGSVISGDNLTIDNGAIVTLNAAANRTLRFEAGDNILFDTGRIQTQGSGTHTVELVADTEADIVTDTDGGAIEQSDGTPSITTNNLLLDSSTGVGSGVQALVIDVDELAGRVTNSGDIFIDEANDLIVGTVSGLAGINTSTGAGAVEISAANLRLNQTVNTGTGSVLMALTGALIDGDSTINGTLTDVIADTLTITSATMIGEPAGTNKGPIEIDVANASITNIGGDIHLVAQGSTNGTVLDLTAATNAPGNITVTSSDKDLVLTDVSTQNGSITIETLAREIGAVNIDTSMTDIDANDIILRTVTSGNITVDNVVAGTLNGDVLVDSSEAILEAVADVPEPQADISGHQLELIAVTGIGITTPLDPIEIDATDLAATTGTGGISLFDVQGGLLITAVDVVGAGSGTEGLSISGAFGGDLELSVDGSLTVDAPITTTSGGNIKLATTGIDNDLTIQGEVSGGGAGTIIDLSSDGANLLVFANVVNPDGDVSLFGGEATVIDSSRDAISLPVEVKANNITVSGKNFIIQSGGTSGDTAAAIATSDAIVDINGSMHVRSSRGRADFLGQSVNIRANSEVNVVAGKAPANIQAEDLLTIRGNPDVSVSGGNVDSASASIEAGGHIDMTAIESLAVTGGSSTGSTARIESTGGNVTIGTTSNTTNVDVDSGSGNNGSNPNAKIHARQSANINAQSMSVTNRGGGAQIISNSLSSINVLVTGELVLSSGLTGQCLGLECLFVIDVPGASQAARNAAINLTYGELVICNGVTGCTQAQVNLFLNPPPVDAPFAELPLPPEIEEIIVETPDSLENIVVSLWDETNSILGFEEDDDDSDKNSAYECN